MLSVLDAKEFSNFNTIRGIEDEPYARARYQCVYGVEVNILGYFNPPEMPWLGCSADGVVSGEILFETKSPECGIVQTARTIVPIINYIELDKDGNWTLKKRHPYYGQVQLCMALLGLKLCHFVIYASYDDSIAVIKVSYDEVFARLLIAKLTDLYFTYYLPLLRRRNFAPWFAHPSHFSPRRTCALISLIFLVSVLLWTEVASKQPINNMGCADWHYVVKCAILRFSWFST